MDQHLIRKCPLCKVEYLGTKNDHDCESDAWARPIAQLANATGKTVEGTLGELLKDGINCA